MSRKPRPKRARAPMPDSMIEDTAFTNDRTKRSFTKNDSVQPPVYVMDDRSVVNDFTTAARLTEPDGNAEGHIITLTLSNDVEIVCDHNGEFRGRFDTRKTDQLVRMRQKINMLRMLRGPMSPENVQERRLAWQRHLEEETRNAQAIKQARREEKEQERREKERERQAEAAALRERGFGEW